MRWAVVSRLLREPTLGAEIGTRAGEFTEYVLKMHPQLTMFAVDTWSARPGYEDYDFTSIRRDFDIRTGIYGERVRVLPVDTLVAAQSVADASLDFVFIDADHAYASVASDIDAWRGKVKAGGLICGHDYDHPRFPGVKRAVDERFTVALGDDRVWWVRC